MIRQRIEKKTVRDGENIIEKETSITEKIIPKTDEPPFVKLYLDTVLLTKNVSISKCPILNELLKLQPYADEQIPYFAINKPIKLLISKNTNLGIKAIEKAITEFVKSGILIRVLNGLYQVNPQYFGKGNWSDVKKIREITMKIRFSEYGTEVKTEIKKATKIIAPESTAM